MWDWACISATDRRVDQAYFSDGLWFLRFFLCLFFFCYLFFTLVVNCLFTPDSLVILMCFFGPALVLYYEETNLTQLGRSDYRT